MNSKTSPLSLTRSGLVSAFGIAFLVAAVPCDPLYAGLLTIKNLNPGSFVTFSYRDPTPGDGQIRHKEPAPGGKAAVTVEYSLGSLENEKKIGSVFVTKTPFGQTVLDPYEMLIPSVGSVGSLEPFDIPTFADELVPLVAVVDIAALLTQGDPFTDGEAISVLNGMTLITSAITFKDGSSLGPDPILTDALFASLPAFTGSAVVYGFDDVTATPEPTYTYLLLAVLGAGLVVVRRRRFSS